jgi:hypothetical protein
MTIVSKKRALCKRPKKPDYRREKEGKPTTSQAAAIYGFGLALLAEIR